MTAPLADAEARRRIREDLEATLFVEAAAGTGKTTALVERIVALLRAGRAELASLAAVTFTEKAAGEMKLRLRAEIERARAAAVGRPDELVRLELALAQLEVARIGTIHGFCGDLLRERPVEAGVDPLFEVAPEDESGRLLDEAFERWLEQVLADPPEGVRRVLRRRASGANAVGPREQLRRAVTVLVEHRDFPAPWRRDGFDRAAALGGVMEALEEVAALAGRAERPEDDWLAKNLAEIARFLGEVKLLERLHGRDPDGLEARLRELARSRQVHWHWVGYRGKPYARGLSREEVAARRDAARARLDSFLADAEADLAACLREELRPVVDAYEAAKARAGRLDFLDLLVRTRDLLLQGRGVREGFQRRFTHLFVDEFQDTDPLQAEILLLLAAEDPAETDWRRVTSVPGKLFVVGDPKQSIYRFRRADVAVYEAVKRQLVARDAALLHLSTSFRAVPSLQSAVNAAFAPSMQAAPDGTQAGYVALERFRGEADGQPALVVLPVPRPYGDYGKVVAFRIEESLPHAVGAFVDWLVRRSGWTVEEGGARVPVAPRHVCLLFRRFKSWQDDVTRPYVRALEARGVAHVLVGGRSFHEREEVLALRNALFAVEWPDDELRVYATLRGPLFALGDDALLAWRQRVGRFHALRRLGAEEAAKLDPQEREVAEALAVLGRLHAGRNRRSLAETIARLLEAVRAHAGIAIWPTGEQALANVLRGIDLARRFERRGAPSFRAFVEHLEREAERGEAEDAPVVEEGTEGVRIMTVHRAKGLEFPVVVLADPTCQASSGRPSRHVDAARGLWAEPLCGAAPRDLLDAAGLEARHDAEEGVRIAYVAATRARDLLVVPALGEGEPGGADDVLRDSWLAVLAPVIHPAEERRRDSTPAPGCPAFGEDSALERPDSARGGAASAVRPGLHRPRAGAHTVVWWDPRALEIDREEAIGLRQQRILEADAKGEAVARGEQEHAAWQAARRGALERGGEPSVRVATVTERSAQAGTSEAEPVAVEETALDRRGRPGGVRFGTLVHAVLAALDLGAATAGGASTDAARALDAVARVQGRLLGASEGEVSAAVVAARAALEHPLLRRAAEAATRGELRRETPVLLRLPDGSLVEGVVDLAFREAEAGGEVWTVVDFKTDRELTGPRARYEEQVRLYARAVAAATGEPARGVLLVV